MGMGDNNYGGDDNDLLDTIEIEGIAHPIAEEGDYNGLLMTKTDMQDTLAALNNGEAYLADTHGDKVGRVTSGRIDFLGRLRVVLEMSAKEHPELADKLLNKAYKGLSLGLKHFVNPKTLEVNKKKIIEVSICPEGDLPGTGIQVVRRENRKDIAGAHAALDARLERELRPIPILTQASAGWGLEKPFALQQLDFQIDRIGKVKKKETQKRFNNEKYSNTISPPICLTVSPPNLF